MASRQRIGSSGTKVLSSVILVARRGHRHPHPRGRRRARIGRSAARGRLHRRSARHGSTSRSGARLEASRVKDRRIAKPALGRRFLGVPWLWAVAHSAVAFSVYYSIGVVADEALALTPVDLRDRGADLRADDDDLRRGRRDVPRARRLEHARPPRVQRARQLRRRLGDPDRLRDRDRARRGHASRTTSGRSRRASPTAPASRSSRSASSWSSPRSTSSASPAAAGRACWWR